MALHRTTVTNQMDYNRESKEGKPSTDERLDSGVDSLKEEDYQAVAEEIWRLQLECQPSQNKQLSACAAAEIQEWKTQITEDGDTLLHLAIIHEATDYIKMMIELSKNTDFLDVQNDQRQTALHLAVITNQSDVCQRLLAAGCDPTLVDDSGDMPVHIACRHGNLLCFSVLTQFCRPEHLQTMTSACNYQGQNCLHLASVYGFLSLVENLVDLGADVNSKEQRNGRSGLHLAVDQQNLSLVKLLPKFNLFDKEKNMERHHSQIYQGTLLPIPRVLRSLFISFSLGKVKVSTISILSSYTECSLVHEQATLLICKITGQHSMVRTVTYILAL
uniref:NF-kappa-B inhibitor alpha n=1 Tax=Hippocampus comes TaxID=109280 RepID=A0A3Q2YSL9_HIPCM